MPYAIIPARAILEKLAVPLGFIWRHTHVAILVVPSRFPGDHSVPERVRIEPTSEDLPVMLGLDGRGQFVQAYIPGR